MTQKKIIGNSVTEGLGSRFNEFSIELDCAPGNPRPDDLFAGVLKDTGFDVVDFDTPAPFFGHQIWILKESANKDDMFAKAKPVFKERVTALYNSGLIRYGTW